MKVNKSHESQDLKEKFQGYGVGVCAIINTIETLKQV